MGHGRRDHAVRATDRRRAPASRSRIAEQAVGQRRRVVVVGVLGVDDRVERPAAAPGRPPAASAAGRAGPSTRPGRGRRTGCSPARRRRCPAPCARRAPRRGRRGPCSSVSPSWVATLQTKTRRPGAARTASRMPGKQEAGQQARVQAARSEDDQVGLGDGREGVLGRVDVVGRQPDALDAGRAHDRRLAVDDRAVAQAGVEGERRRGHRQDLAADGEDPVQLPQALLEVAALDRGHRRDEQVADGVAAQPGMRVGTGRRSRGNRYWSSSFMSGSASASAAMQLRMSPTGGMPSSWRRTPDDPPSSATVTTAVRLLVCSLRPRRSGGQPGPAADRHDPGAAGEEALLVDDLDERLVAVGGSERGHERPDHADRTEGDERDADPPDDEPAQRVRQELEGQDVDDGLCRRRRARGPRLTWRSRWANARAEQEHPDEHDEEPALDADPGRQPAPQVHRRSSSRWKTAIGPTSRSRNQVASSSAMTIERWKPPVQPMAMVSRVLPSATYAGIANSRKPNRKSRNCRATGWSRTKSRTSSRQARERAGGRRCRTGSP